MPEKLDLLATCPRGIEQLLATELATFGLAPGKSTVAGVNAEGDLEGAYRACLWSRLANRVILCVARVEGVETPDSLRDAAAAIDWQRHVRPGATIAVDFHGRSEQIRHTRFGAQTVKDGVVDRLTASGQARPDVDTRQPDVRLYAHLHRGAWCWGSTCPAIVCIVAAIVVTRAMLRSRRTWRRPCWCVPAGLSWPSRARP